MRLPRRSSHGRRRIDRARRWQRSDRGGVARLVFPCSSAWWCSSPRFPLQLRTAGPVADDRAARRTDATWPGSTGRPLTRLVVLAMIMRAKRGEIGSLISKEEMLARVKKLTVAMTKRRCFRNIAEKAELTRRAGRGCLPGAGIGHRAPCPERGRRRLHDTRPDEDQGHEEARAKGPEERAESVPAWRDDGREGQARPAPP